MRGMRGCGYISYELALSEARESETRTNCLVDERGRG